MFLLPPGFSFPSNLANLALASSSSLLRFRAMASSLSMRFSLCSSAAALRFIFSSSSFTAHSTQHKSTRARTLCQRATMHCFSQGKDYVAILDACREPVLLWNCRMFKLQPCWSSLGSD